ncbi:putative fasciclin-like arabinogalactan protein 20 [Impatiens glandulifera]|uniref:putative fasciclin-like arabinogalactan protein 20 n=1 Tax=Impatiens glandulifera TaxID=253017 RepID=UPI001FB0CBD3|nr:putative fasciclin-like arabinogalactan protein 20 [Impatiens glandulifera]
MAKKALLLHIILFAMLSPSSQLSNEVIQNAIEALSNSGFVSMSLTIELVSSFLSSLPPSVTMFSPSDSAFSKSGQPSLDLLQYHFTQLPFSLETIRSLPYGTEILTMSSGKSLFVTSSPLDHKISLNNVTICGYPVHDDGSLIIFGIDEFFDPEFEFPQTVQTPIPDLGCVISSSNLTSSFPVSSFIEASVELRSRGYSVIASYLDVQLLGFLEPPKLTIFAPVDDVMTDYVSNFTEDSSLFLRHVIPCRVTWSDLASFEDGTPLQTFAEGSSIRLTRFNHPLLLNDVPIAFPDMYISDSLVIHGLHGILERKEMPEPDESPSVQNDDCCLAPDHSEF